MNWLGLDIGGANLKIADGQGYANSVSFPLWRHPEQLPSRLAELIDQAPPSDALAVTMTGELADCFESKAAGVESILDAVDRAANGRRVEVYLCDGRLVPPNVARADTMLAAASNWHVLASYVRRYIDSEFGLLVDIGSTTCDLIPLGRSGPCAHGKTDPERLVAGELVYTGIERSPVCAVVSHLPWQGKQCPVAQEFFATTRDAYVLLEELSEEPKNLDTADGRPSTKPYAHARLARSICADTTMFSLADAEQAAVPIRDAQLELLANAAERVVGSMPSVPTTIVLSGHGEFLARQLIERLGLSAEVVSLTSKLGPDVSRAACAHALAVLASERCDA